MLFWGNWKNCLKILKSGIKELDFIPVEIMLASFKRSFIEVCPRTAVDMWHTDQLHTSLGPDLHTED
jgi:hypothetical protein